MFTRSILPVTVNAVMVLSSATSTAVVTAVDLANFFPVNRREVRFVVSVITSSTSLGNALTVLLEECDSTSTTAFTQVLAVDGSTASFPLAANAVSFSTYFDAAITKRYIRTRYVGTTSTGGTIALSVVALPLVRAA
jgi:hypothetical protein